MNESDNNGSLECKNICMTCLETTNDLHPMSFECKTEYKKFVEMEEQDPEMMICGICCRLFQRILRFKQQCHKARTMFKNAMKMDLKSDFIFQKLTLCYNLGVSKAVVCSFPENTLHLSSEKFTKDNLLVNGSPVNNLLVNGTSVSNLQVNDSRVNNLQVNGSRVNDPQVNGSPDNQMQDDRFDNTEFNYDDELPLVMLSKSNDRKSKKRKRRKELDQKTEETRSELEVISSKKDKKQLKEGFTSRMVQETDEYIVIKLTREQVLQEMAERSVSEPYVQSPYKCQKCVKAFNFQDVLATHMEKHSTDIGSFQCDMCSQYCRSAVSLRGHIKSHTTRYKCKLCGVVRLSRQHLLEHHAIMHTRQAVTYSCDTCKFTTNKRTVMQRHVKGHAKCEPHACEKCGKLFKSIDSLRVHTMRHDKSSRLRCAVCDVSFVYHSLLRRHVTRVHERRDYYCVECDAQFKSNESLRLHFKKAKKHRDSSAYKHACPQCPVRLVSAGALAAHASAAHGAVRAHACAAAACRRRYSTRDALRAHVWRTHSRHMTH